VVNTTGWRGEWSLYRTDFKSPPDAGSGNAMLGWTQHRLRSPAAPSRPAFSSGKIRPFSIGARVREG